MELFKNLFIKNSHQVVLVLFSVLICHYTGNRGVFPIDSFGHFDSAFRILNDEHPFRDFWIVSGPFIDYFQSFLFYIFGVNWQTYILSASLLNSILTVTTYYLFLTLGLEKNYSFFYSICFAILGYPSSGTPFVDHHSLFLSLLAVYFLIFAMKNKNKFFWIAIPFIMVIAFLSKQVPTLYIFIIIIFLIAYHLVFSNKKLFLNIFSKLTLSSFIILSLFFFFLKFNQIEFKDFYLQYILYPGTLGNERYENINYDIKNLFLNFKFIYFILLILCFFIFKKLQKKKNFHQSLDFKIFLIFIFLFISLIHHLLLTKNQIFIFFLIPLFLGFTQIQIQFESRKTKKFLSFFFILSCILLTLKYHYRYNVERKFHEFNNTNFNQSISAILLSKKFKGLQWITPDVISMEQNNDNIYFLNNVKKILKNDKKNKIVITNYSFFSVLLNENVSAYSRWFPGDNSAFPRKGDIYFNDYKKFIDKILKNKNIENIYILPDVSENQLLDYIEISCLSRNEMQFDIVKFSITDKC